jgi:hypothetical protein
MTSTVLSICDIPGPRFRHALRRAMIAGQPWKLIVDTRVSPSPALDRIAIMLRLTRRARKQGGDVIVVVDAATRRRVNAAGLDHWLRLACTVDEARSRLDPQTARSASPRTTPSTAATPSRTASERAQRCGP